MTIGQEMERVYSHNAGARTGSIKMERIKLTAIYMENIPDWSFQWRSSKRRLRAYRTAMLEH